MSYSELANPEVYSSIQFIQRVGETIQSNKATGLHWGVLLEYFNIYPWLCKFKSCVQICPIIHFLQAFFHSWRLVCKISFSVTSQGVWFGRLNRCSTVLPF